MSAWPQGVLCRVGPCWAVEPREARRTPNTARLRPREGVDWGAGHVAADCFDERDAEALAPADYDSQNPPD